MKFFFYVLEYFIMTIIKNEFILALNQLANEKGISIDEIINSIESALVAAYNKEYPEKFSEKISAKINRETGEVKIFKDDKDITPPGFGRIGAQTAKQVIMQKIREAEKSRIINFYQSLLGNIIRGRILRYESRGVLVDIGKTEAILPKEEQIKNEEYKIGQTLTFFLKKIDNDKYNNPRIILSRNDPRLLAELLKKEVPEVNSKMVEIKKIVREPGERAKVSVFSKLKGVDPVGACVGQKGIRIQTITNELGGNEKIDVIQWTDNDKVYIGAALSPAKVTQIEIDKKNKKAKVFLKEDQVPLAIGKGGVNVSLASKLTEFSIEIIPLNTNNQTPNSNSKSKHN